MMVILMVRMIADGDGNDVVDADDDDDDDGTCDGGDHVDAVE